jgi:hypothetical protein
LFNLNKLLEKNKEITKTWLAGQRSCTLVIPKGFAREYGLDEPSHVLVEGTPNGIIDGNDLIIFKRYNDDNKKQQVVPSNDYDPNKRYLLDLLSKFRFKYEHQKKIQEVYIVSLFIYGLIHPVHITYGSEGSGKSLFQYMAKSLLDPYESPAVSTLADKMATSFEDLDTDDRRSWDRALVIEQN